MNRNVTIVTDTNENRIVLIHDIIFRGKKNIKWEDVKEYLKNYAGEFYQVADTKDVVYIGNELPDEYTGSKYTYSLKGMKAKAKANFALPVYDESGEVERYNVFHASMLIRHANDGKMYLYDILDIKKKRATRSNSYKEFYLAKTHFLI